MDSQRLGLAGKEELSYSGWLELEKSITNFQAHIFIHLTHLLTKVQKGCMLEGFVERFLQENPAAHPHVSTLMVFR